MKKLLFVLAISIMALSSCKKEPDLGLSTGTASVSAAGEVITVDVTANTSWKATPNNSAIIVNPASGTGNATVSITVPENPTSTPQEYKVNFVATNEVGLMGVDFIITQQGTDANITVKTPSDLALNGYETSFKVMITG